MDTEVAQAPDQTTASQPQAGEETQGSELNAEAWHDQLQEALASGKVPEGFEDEEAPIGEEPETDTEEQPEETEEETEESEQEEPGESDEPEDESESERPKSNRPRLRATNAVEALAFQIKKENKDWSLAECEAKAKLALGIEEKDEAESVEEEKGEEITDYQALEARLAQLRAERKQAILDFDAEKQAELTDEIDRLVDLRPQLQQKESAKAKSAEAEFDQKFDQAWKRAVELYPDAGKENSVFAKTMAEIDKELKASGSPLFKEPDKAVTIAHMAAKKLLIAPATVKAAPRQSKPVSPLAKGSSATRTTTTQDALEKDIDSITNTDDLEKLAARLGVRGMA